MGTSFLGELLVLVLFLFLHLGNCCLGSTGLGRYHIFLVVTIRMECIQNHVAGPRGSRDMTTFVKHVFFLRRSLWVITMVEKRVKVYIEWCSQSRQRLDFDLRYEDIMMI